MYVFTWDWEVFCEVVPVGKPLLQVLMAGLEFQSSALACHGASNLECVQSASVPVALSVFQRASL